MTIVVCIPAHGASVKGKTIKTDKAHIIAPVRAGDVMHFATFNIISKMLLEIACNINSGEALLDRIHWLAEIPTTELVKPGKTINEFTFSSAFDILSQDTYLLPLSHLKQKYGEYMNAKLHYNCVTYEIYIDKKSLTISIKSSLLPEIPQHSTVSSTKTITSHFLVDGALIYMLPTGVKDCTASEILQCLKYLHILVSSDKKGENIVIEQITSGVGNYSIAVDRVFSSQGKWMGHYPDRKLEDVMLHDIIVPEENLSVLVSSCRGWESGDICSVMGDSSSFARDSVVD